MREKSVLRKMWRPPPHPTQRRRSYLESPWLSLRLISLLICCQPRNYREEDKDAQTIKKKKTQSQTGGKKGGIKESNGAGGWGVSADMRRLS